MKKSLLLIATIAMAMAACTKDAPETEFGAPVAPYSDICVNATIDGDTRTSMAPNAGGGLDIAWVAGDGIGMFAEDANGAIGNNTKYTAATSEATSKFIIGVGETSIKWGEGEHTFYAYYPYASEATDFTAVPIEVPAVQTQSEAGNMDHLQPYAFLYAQKSVNASASVDLKFSNALSVLEVNLCSEAGSIDCEAVIFRAEEGSEVLSTEGATIDLTDGVINTSAATNSNQIKVELTNNATLDTENPQSFYMMITPGHGGKRFSFYAVVNGKEVKLGSKKIPASGLPAGAKATIDLNVPAVDLSADGTANCYVVNQPGTTYKFKATVKGNGYDPIAGTSASAIDLTDATAEIFWAYMKCTNDGANNTGLNASVLRNSVEIKDGYIFFKTSDTMLDGNLAIRVKDSEGKTMWSWHIWAVQDYDYVSEAVDVTAHGADFKIMDRNLGAFSNPAALAAPTKDDYAFALGLYYQWGRKDPFMCGGSQYGRAGKTWFDFIKNGSIQGSPTFALSSNDKVNGSASSVYHYYDFIADHGLTDFNEILTHSIQNPLQFYKVGGNWAWSTNSNGQITDWGKLWGNQLAQPTGNPTKTMYDPCPVGYVVASPEHFTFISSTGELSVADKPTWQLNTPTTDVANVDPNPIREAPWGLEFYTKGARTADSEPDDKTTVFIPRQHWIENNGRIQDWAYINLYTNAPSPESSWGGQPYKVRVEPTGFAQFKQPSWTSAAQPACAFPVRCVSENGMVSSTGVEAIDLSANGTANCYVVNQPGTTYKFKATVKGNGYDPITGAAAEAIDLRGATAEIFWAYKKATGDGADNTGLNLSVLRNSVYINGDYIYLTTPASMEDGNLAIRIKDSEGKTMWSWHIWAIQGYDYASAAVDVTAHGADFKIMDRNLGAFSNPAALATPTEDDYAFASGLLYQWGRKDPFLCGGTQKLTATWFDFIKNGVLVKSPTFSIKGSGQYNYNDFIAPHGLSDFSEILEHSIQNPLQFYTSDKNWITTESPSNGQTSDWGKLWGNQKANGNGVKTMYDPCPVGYTVASPDHFKFVVSVENKAELIERTATWTTPSPSWYYNTPNIDFDIAEPNPIENSPWGLYFYTKGTRTESAEPADKTTVFLPRHLWIQNTGSIKEEIPGLGKAICLYTNAPSNYQDYGGGPYKLLIRKDGYANIKAGYWHSAAQAACALPVRCVSEAK